MTFFESIIAFDNTLFMTINSAHTPFFDIFFQIITFFGTAFVIVPLLVVIVYRTIPKKQRSRILLFGVVSIGASGIINQGIKSIVRRPRPISYFLSETQAAPAAHPDRPVYNVHILGPKLKYRSFPSGHSNTVFATATFLVLLYGGWYWTSFLMALLVAYSRMYMGVHFFLDTLIGALLGILVVLILYKAFGVSKYVMTSGVQHDT
ncbi:MAG TPA: phosphatase PAP2 family protein [Chitinispirillaceae bacterium]|nr:phosphatase PAP2 family protein [Chitinispirillaceae bacterium]